MCQFVHFHKPTTTGAGVRSLEAAKQPHVVVGPRNLSAAPSQRANKRAIAWRGTATKIEKRDKVRRARAPCERQELQAGMAGGARKQTNVPAVAGRRLRPHTTHHIPCLGQEPWRVPEITRPPASQSNYKKREKKRLPLGHEP